MRLKQLYQKVNIAFITAILLQTTTANIAYSQSVPPYPLEPSPNTPLRHDFENPSVESNGTNQETNPNARTGNFILKMGLFKINANSCEVVANSQKEYTVIITDNNDTLSISAPIEVPMQQGNISVYNRVNDALTMLFQAGGNSPIQWRGVFNADGNEMFVIGTATCGDVSQLFTLEGYFKNPIQ
ncbi:hypothetical protein H6G93_18640 [Nostoc sp. FACHB-973]|nr:hypothetical protein [Nostoc sp. FACHB-973]